jgi:hypothetical protein
VIQLIASLLTAAAALASGWAAWLWLLASKVDAPKTLEGTHMITSRAEPHKPNVVIDASPIIDFAQESGKRNKAAATWSAVAALFAFLSWGLGLVAHPDVPLDRPQGTTGNHASTAAP